MSLSIALSGALSALQVAQKSLEITSHNIANAQTPGYSRQVIHRESLTNGGHGGGVAIASIARQIDQHLVRDIRAESGVHAAQGTTARFLELLTQSFGTLDGGTSLGATLSGLAVALESASIEPESPARMRQVVDAAAAVARELNAVSSQITSLQRQADTEIATSIAGVNTALADIASLNRRIAQDEAAGRSTSDLRDARDRAIDKVAEQMDISYFERPNGEIVLYAASGHLLVDTDASTLARTADGDITIDGAVVTGRIGSGKLKALIELRDTTLPRIQQDVDLLSVTVRDAVNQVHNRGTAFPPPPSLTGTRPFPGGPGETITLSDPVRIAVLDAAGVVQSHVDLPAGAYTLADLVDAIDTGLGAAGTATLGPDGQLSISAAATGNGISIVDLAAGADSIVTHGGADHAGFSSFFGLNDVYVTPGTAPGETAGAGASLRVRSDIAADPARLASGRLNDAAVLDDGTSVGMARGDNRTLLALAARFDEPIAFPAAGSMPAVSMTLGEYANQFVGIVASETAAASERRDYQEGLIAGLKTKAGAVSGVNVDEEMAQLMVLQNAYAASARLISTVSEMLRTLTDIA